MADLKLRPEVHEFAQAMERTLRRHDQSKGKRGWKRADKHYLFGLVCSEFAELSLEMACADPDQLEHECVDLANLVMMLRDRSRATG